MEPGPQFIFARRSGLQKCLAPRMTGGSIAVSFHALRTCRTGKIPGYILGEILIWSRSLVLHSLAMSNYLGMGTARMEAPEESFPLAGHCVWSWAVVIAARI